MGRQASGVQGTRELSPKDSRDLAKGRGSCSGTGRVSPRTGRSLAGLRRSEVASGLGEEDDRTQAHPQAL